MHCNNSISFIHDTNFKIMAKKTIIGKLIEKIFGDFKENWPSFVAKMFRKVPDDVREKVSIGINIVENIKTWLGGSTADFITHIIPSDYDDELRVRLISLCSVILKLYEKVETVDKMKLEQSEKLSIAANINSSLTGFTFGQSAVTTEIVYNGLKSDGKLA